MKKGYIYSISPIIEITGDLPKNGYVIVITSCQIAADFSNGFYTVKKDFDSKKISILDGNRVQDEPNTYAVYDNGTPVYFEPSTCEKCASGEANSTPETISGCMKWYTYGDDGIKSDKINLILDHNIARTVVWNSANNNSDGPVDVLTRKNIDTVTWGGLPARDDSYTLNNGSVNYTINYSLYKARLITAAEIAKITGNDAFDELTTKENNWFYFDSNSQVQTATQLGTSNYS